MTELITKGAKLEYQLMRLLFYQGYLARRRFLIKSTLEAKLSDVTDLDILGVSYDLQFLEHKSIVECKSGAKTQPVANILSLKALKDLTGAESAIFALSSTPWDIKEFGTSLDIRVLTQDRIRDIEAELEIDNDYWIASTNYQFYETEWSKWQKLLADDPVAKRLLELLRTEFWFRSPWILINRLILAIDRLPERLLVATKNPEYEFNLWLLFEAIVHFAIACLRVCTLVYHLPTNQRKGIIEKHLTFGDHPKKAQETFALAYKLASEAAKNSQGNTLPSTGFAIPAPDYTETFIDLIDRMCSKPKAATQVARTLEILLFQYLLPNNAINHDELSFFVGSELYDFKLKAAKDILMFLVSNTNVQKELLDIVLTA